MNINLFYNYYNCNNIERQQEIDYCLKSLIETPEITNIYLWISEDDISIFNIKFKDNVGKIIPIINNNRPTFYNAIYDVLKIYSDKDDINILINSDCFFGKNTNWNYIYNINKNLSLSISRYEILNINPFTISKLPVNITQCDSQDCWIFKGIIENLDCNFCFGHPGCDNRITYELGQYTNVINNAKDIQLLHYHLSATRNYTEKERVYGRYKWLNVIY